MLTLGVETSCDETAVALVEDGEVLSSEVSSSVHLHSPYGGVVPEIASRFHVEYIYPVMRKALEDAGRTVGDVDLVAVTQGPGLPGSLLVGIAFAKAVSFADETPVIGVDHLHAHIFSCFQREGKENVIGSMFPFVGVVISGGHTSIYLCRGISDLTVIGSTRDDAVGEAFDKVAKILGLGYPGGPVVEKRAAAHTGKDEIGFPRTLLGEEDLDFSFSGIKTSVLYYWQRSAKTESDKSSICFSFQEAVMDVLVEKITRAVRTTGARRLAVGGGVVNNKSLRERIKRLCDEEEVELFLPDGDLCTDNAAMVAGLGEVLFAEGARSSDLFLNARPAGV